MAKIYKVGVKYYSSKKKIFGLEIYRPIFKDFGGKFDKYSVYEDTSPNCNFWDRKNVFSGSLSACRDYMKKRFKKK